MHKYFVIFLSVLTIITITSLCPISAKATNEPYTATGNFTDKSTKNPPPKTTVILKIFLTTKTCQFYVQ